MVKALRSLLFLLVFLFFAFIFSSPKKALAAGECGTYSSTCTGTYSYTCEYNDWYKTNLKIPDACWSPEYQVGYFCYSQGSNAYISGSRCYFNYSYSCTKSIDAGQACPTGGICQQAVNGANNLTYSCGYYSNYYYHNGSQCTQTSYKYTSFSACQIIFQNYGSTCYETLSSCQSAHPACSASYVGSTAPCSLGQVCRDVNGSFQCINESLNVTCYKCRENNTYLTYTGANGNCATPIVDPYTGAAVGGYTSSCSSGATCSVGTYSTSLNQVCLKPACSASYVGSNYPCYDSSQICQVYGSTTGGATYGCVYPSSLNYYYKFDPSTTTCSQTQYKYASISDCSTAWKNVTGNQSLSCYSSQTDCTNANGYTYWYFSGGTCYQVGKYLSKTSCSQTLGSTCYDTQSSCLTSNFSCNASTINQTCPTGGTCKDVNGVFKCIDERLNVSCTRCSGSQPNTLVTYTGANGDCNQPIIDPQTGLAIGTYNSCPAGYACPNGGTACILSGTYTNKYQCNSSGTDWLSAGSACTVAGTTSSNSYCASCQANANTYNTCESNGTQSCYETVNLATCSQTLKTKTCSLDLCDKGKGYTCSASKCVKTITGKVYEDKNCDGQKQTGEQAYPGADLSLNSGYQNAKSDANGNYEFKNLQSGTHTVLLKLPSVDTSYTKIVPSNPRFINLDSLTGTTDFGICRIHQITAYVYVDSDRNGAWSLGDNLYNGPVTLTLSETANAPVKISSGIYKFDGLSGGTYTVNLFLPSGYEAIKPKPPTQRVTVGPSTSIEFWIAPAISSYSISGTVFIDSNNNGAKDPGEKGYNNSSGQAEVEITNPLIPSILIKPYINQNGDYRSNNHAGSTEYSVSITKIPANYSLSSVRSVRIKPASGQAVNFGIIPSCNDGLDCSGGTCSVACGSGGTMTGCLYKTYNGSPSCNPVAPSTPPACAPEPTCAAGLTCNNNRCEEVTYSILPTSRITEDNQGNYCAGASGTPRAGLGLILNPGNLQTNTDGNGNYSFSNLRSGNYALTANVLPLGQNYRVIAVNGNPTGSNTYNFTTPPDQNINFCISNIAPWFQIDSQDVRMKAINNPLPDGKSASTNNNNPSLFISSTGVSSFGQGKSSDKGWVVNSEYDANKNFESARGVSSYTFYKSRATQLGVEVKNLAQITGCTSTCNLPALDSGIYEFDGNLEITNYNHKQGSHVILLVNGNAKISNQIKITENQNNLFVLATKGNILVDKNVGVGQGSPETKLEGIYSAEQSFIAEGDGCQDGNNADKRLNIGGAIIANSLYPFASNGSGKFVNNRSLCGQDKQFPSISVQTRLDFLTEFTDFYKETVSRWQEVNP